MIKNKVQLKVTRKRIKSFEKALLKKGTRPNDVHPILWEAQFNEIEAQLEALKLEVKEYNALITGKVTAFKESFNDLPNVLIKARIAKKLTQKELAMQIGKAEQQIQRWEKEEYKNATFNNLRQIIEVLGVTVIEYVYLKGNDQNNSTSVQSVGTTSDKV